MEIREDDGVQPWPDSKQFRPTELALDGQHLMFYGMGHTRKD